MKDKTIPYISINPYNKLSYIYENGLLRKYNFNKKSKKNFYISFLNNKDFISTTLSISKNILDEDLKDAIEMRVYEELDLDQTVEYKIDFVELSSLPTDKNRIFQVFITEPKKIETIFDDIVKKTGYIDYIIPFPLIFKVLYTKDILSSQENHLFIYFQQEDASVSIYKNGDLIYSKSINYSFKDIASNLSELTSKDISTQEVIKDLSTYGLKMADLEKVNSYMKVFGKLFMDINDILIYAKRSLDIENLDKIFIDTEFGFIAGLEEYALTYLRQEAYGFDFNLSIETKEQFVEKIHFLLVASAQEITNQTQEYPNLSIFPKPLPFLKRPSGQVLILGVAAAILGISYPAYNIALGYLYKYESFKLQKEYNQIHQKKIALENQINRLKKESLEIKKKVELKKQELERSKKVLNSIYNKKVNYILKASTLADLTQSMVKHKLLLTNIELNNTKFDFNVTSKDDKAITKFIQYLIHNKKRYDVLVDKIEKPDENSSLYFTNLKVDVK